MSKKYTSFMLLFDAYDLYMIRRLAEEHDMTVCQYIHWLIRFEIRELEDRDIPYLTPNEFSLDLDYEE